MAGNDGKGPGIAHAQGGRRPQPVFAHPSEAEFAGLLDFYQLAWQYEPRSFPLRYDARGRVVESFTPDFYLPELDLFIELTTLKQSLVTKKNRKLRRLRELYPDVKIKLLYNRDYRNLIFKYGLQVNGPAALDGQPPAVVRSAVRSEREPSGERERAAGQPERAPSGERAARAAGAAQR